MEKKDEKYKENKEVKSAAPSCDNGLIDQRNCRRKCNYLIGLALIIALIGTAFFAVKHQIISAINKERTDFFVEIQKLNTQLIDLQNKLEECHGENNSRHFFESKRRGWQAWCRLRFKLENNENYEEELANFKQIFANDNVLLSKISDLLKDFSNGNSTDDTNKSGINGFYDKVKSVVSFKKIDKRKMREIVGYVLTSNCR